MEPFCDQTDMRLLDEWQRDFPLEEQPFSRIGAELGIQEQEILDRLRALSAAGRITRVGATCAPNTISASTLAAVAAPPDKVEEVAAIIGAEPGVNHSYQRENRWNLWFVATGPNRAHIDNALNSISHKTSLRVLDLPLVRPFNVDLGFRMTGDREVTPAPRTIRTAVLCEDDRPLLDALTSGLTLCTRPFQTLAKALDRTEADVLDRIGTLQDAGIITRLGIIVRHRALGWRSNAMVVWDISSDRIDRAGPLLSSLPGVTLCYERRPVPVLWPYRLYCMIHARSRGEAAGVLGSAAALPELADAPYRILFSNRCFKQTGAMIAAAKEAAA
jgi:DNA-binding Lrp family transcriptional regulator